MKLKQNFHSEQRCRLKEHFVAFNLTIKQNYRNKQESISFDENVKIVSNITGLIPSKKIPINRSLSVQQERGSNFWFYLIPNGPIRLATAGPATLK